MKYETKSVLISRMPRRDGCDFKTAVIKLFDVNDPHKTGELPTETLEFENIELVCIGNKHVHYFLEGNDIVLNDAGSVAIEQDGTRINIS